MEAESTGSISATLTMLRVLAPEGRVDSPPMTIPTARRVRTGTTTREPGAILSASSSGAAYVKVWKSGTGSATSNSRRFWTEAGLKRSVEGRGVLPGEETSHLPGTPAATDKAGIGVCEHGYHNTPLGVHDKVCVGAHRPTTMR